MTSSIPLAKGLNREKLSFPVFVSEKIDGVPVRIDIAPDGKGETLVGTQSRSGKPLPSVDTLVEQFVIGLMEKGVSMERPMTFVAEVTHKTLKDFKDVSGVVRKQEPQEDLQLNFFDFVFHNGERDPFSIRTQTLCTIVSGIPDCRYIPQAKLNAAMLVPLLENIPDHMEGLIARSHNAEWKPNTRHWDYQKIVIDPTVDLRIVDFEEAVDKDGNPKAMVGRLIAEFKGGLIGIGPGKLTHTERTNLWRLKTDHIALHGKSDAYLYDGGIATIKYKRDQSYSALRQPTFQHWRPEKTEASYD